MLFTKDNLIKFIRQKKYVLPTDVSKEFETTSMFASATLSDLNKDKVVGITYLKNGSSPFYYDINQKNCLIELGEKYLSKYDKDVFEKLRNSQILPENALDVQERVAVERIKDFAIPFHIDFKGQQLKFYVWYLRNLDETKKQVLDALKTHDDSSSGVGQAVKEQVMVEEENKVQGQGSDYDDRLNRFSTFQQFKSGNGGGNGVEDVQKQQSSSGSTKTKKKGLDDLECEQEVEKFFDLNSLKIEFKNKYEDRIVYKARINVAELVIVFDCCLYKRKTREADLLNFFTSSNNPKVVFVKKPAKKLLRLAETIDNFHIVDLEK